MKSRLRSMGIHTGNTIEVINRVGGQFIISAGCSRLVLDDATAENIVVD